MFRRLFKSQIVISIILIASISFTTVFAYGEDIIIREDTSVISEKDKEDVEKSKQMTEEEKQVTEEEKQEEQIEEAPAPEIYLDEPKITSWNRLSSVDMKLTWEKVSNCDGYEIQYSTKDSFKDKYTSYEMTRANSSQKVISNLIPNTKYYVRIRAYKETEDASYYSAWTTYAPIYKDRSASTSIVKKSGKNFELNSQLGNASKNYDVLQGSCTDGKYAYYVMFSKTYLKCKIAKFRLSDNKLIKTSKALNFDHGNGITYNSSTKELVTVDYGNRALYVVKINPSTLKIKKNIKLKIPSALPGASSKNLQAIKGITAISYSEERNQYAARIKGSYNYLILDENLNPVKYVKIKKYSKELNQAIDVTADYILNVQSPKTGSYNIITVYDWDGEYLYKVKVSKKYEIESIYHVGNIFYAGFYKSYYKTYYTTHYKTYKVKWKKVKGKWKYKTKYKYKKVKYKVKWKKVNGKWKYKTKTKKVKVKYKVAHKKFARANYVYNIGEIL